MCSTQVQSSQKLATVPPLSLFLCFSVGKMYSHQMVLALQVDLVVQEVLASLFLGNLVTQSSQEVLAVPPHLQSMIRIFVHVQEMGTLMWHALAQTCSPDMCSTFYPLRPWGTCFTILSRNARESNATLLSWEPSNTWDTLRTFWAW